jgi:uncharacterized protein (DUF488 family)
MEEHAHSEGGGAPKCLQVGPVFTIGHSNVPLEKLLTLLQENAVQVLVDVRSVPYSRYVPQANREALVAAVTSAGIKYVFLGDQLGGQPKGIEVADMLGQPDYSQLAATEAFHSGMSRVIKEAGEHRICLLCSEEDPVRCHRGLLIGRELAKRGIDVRHIRHDGNLDSQADLEKRRAPVQGILFQGNA